MAYFSVWRYTLTWYNKKIKKHAISGSYGAWLSPEGELTPVEFQDHVGAAGKILGVPGNSYENEMELLRKGYAALTFLGGLTVRIFLGLTDQQIKKILSIFNSQSKNEATIVSQGEERTAKDAQELFFLLTDSKVTFANSNYKILKKANMVYGHWISPNGQVIEVEEYQGHANAARQILEDLGEDVQADAISGMAGVSNRLMELGWTKTAYEAEEMLITATTTVEQAQANVVQKLAQMSPKRLQMFLVEIPSKTRYLMRTQVGQLAKFLTNEQRRIASISKDNKKIVKNSSSSNNIKTAKKEYKSLQDFINDPDAIDTGPKNQKGDFSNLYDVQRYVMDSYSTKTSISETKKKITVSILTTHGFLGSVAFNKYWTYEKSEWKQAIEVYKKVNEITKETIEDFVDEEITSTVFWPILKFKLDQIEPEKNAACNIPWVNYSRYYQTQDEPDWRKNIYGPRYPKYDEPSYDQEVRRKGVFFD